MANAPDPHPRAAPQGGARPAGETTIARGALGLAIRGLLGILLGVVLVSTPAEQMLPFAMLASAWMLLEAVFVVALIVLRIAHAGERRDLGSWRDPVVFAAGAVILLVPAFPFLPIVTAWGLVAGMLMPMVVLATARRGNVTADLRWLALASLAVVSYGALLIRGMTIALDLFTASLGAFTTLFGIALVALALRLRPRGTAPSGQTMLAGPTR